MHRSDRLRLVALAAMMLFPLMAAEHRGVVQFGGLPLPGATVTVTQGAEKRATITDQQGGYSFTDLADGMWSMRVEMLCFAPLVRDVAVSKDTPAAEWNLKLLPLAEIQSAAGPALPVSRPPASAAAPPPVKTRRGKPAPPPANTSTAFQRAGVNAANPETKLSDPGAAPQGDAAASESELAQKAADGLLINGTSNNSAASPFALAAAFGNMRKGPRSLYNGSIGLIVDNSSLDARSFSLTGQDTPKPAYSHLTGLLSLGGPLRIPHFLKNGPNLTVNYQWTRDRNAFSQFGRMPTALERMGDLSQTPALSGLPVRIYDPSSGQPFAGNVIPPSRISRQASTLLALYPLPNFDTTARYNYQIPVTGNTHSDNLQSRFNQAAGQKNPINGNFAYQDTRTDNTNLLGFLDTGGTTGINAGVSWRHIFQPRFFMTLGYQYSRLNQRLTPYFANRANISENAGITGNNQDPQNWGPPSLNFSSGITALNDAAPSLIRNQTNILSFDTFFMRGRHNVTAGGDLRRLQFNLLSQQDPRGTFTFTGAAAGSDIAGLLLGVPDTSAIAFGNADKYFRTSSYDAYVTDDIRISPDLTINAGVRWEYSAPIVEKYGRLVNLDIAPGYAGQAPVVAVNPKDAVTGRVYPDSLLQPDKHGFQPRIAMSWRPLSATSTVVRAGYGVYYNTSVYLPIAMQMSQQSPLSKSLSVQNTAANPLTLANGFNASPTTTPNTFAVDPNFRMGYAQNWQVSIQKDLPAALVVTATYLGIKGTRGTQAFLPNTYPAGAPNPCPACLAGYSYLTSNGNSTREAGQFQLRRRLHAGFSASAQYTYSKSIDDAALGGRGQSGPVIAQDWLNLRGERGLSNFDQRHLLNLQGQYSSGSGIRGGGLVSGWRGTLLKDWTVVTQVNAGSGLPLTPIYLAAVSGTGVTGTIRPDFTGAPLYAPPPGLFLNPAAFAAPTAGHWGNAARNSITGPRQFTTTASLGRTFRVSDRASLDLRIDAANPLNHVTFPSWNTTVTSGQFGLPNATNPMRSVQTTLRLKF